MRESVMRESVIRESVMRESVMRESVMREDAYLSWSTNRLIEYTDGLAKVLPLPTQTHQIVVGRLYIALQSFVEQAGSGLALFAPVRVQLWPGKYREPDIVFMSAAHEERRGE
ncbi:MAG TPA: hypothetical protein EYP41_06040 [Anaerolineae bacterium]|nr:hypothetical protein [Anaerolineae bacterium]HIP69870.1 hypothetical protein [Anaerolineae bacterium]